MYRLRIYVGSVKFSTPPPEGAKLDTGLASGDIPPIGLVKGVGSGSGARHASKGGRQAGEKNGKGP